MTATAMRQAVALTAIALLAGCATLQPPPARPVAEVTQNGVTIALYNEPCALREVQNLRRRATWTDARGVFEGCFGVQFDSAVVFYFDDRTVVVLPLQLFQPAHAHPSGTRL